MLFRSNLRIEESVFLADVKGPRSASQIVIHGSMEGTNESSINWSLELLNVTNPDELEDDDEEELNAEIFADE